MEEIPLSSEFSVLAMIDVFSADRISTYLELLRKTSCQFIGKEAKRIFWNSGGTSPLC